VITIAEASGLGFGFRSRERQVRVDECPDAAIAPVAALFRDGEQGAVYMARDGQAQRRRVRAGGRTPNDAWIEDGLAPAECVIVYPSDSVAPIPPIRQLVGASLRSRRPFRRRESDLPRARHD